jgi:hypothetical protein
LQVGKRPLEEYKESSPIIVSKSTLIKTRENRMIVTEDNLENKCYTQKNKGDR